MAHTALGALLRCLRYHNPAAGERSDRELLQDFVLRREEAAFAALVRRHAALVWGVCRRLLHNDADAEDAFQAVFLVLLHKSASLRVGPSLAGWLHAVAARIARKSRVTILRRHLRERRAEGPKWSDPLAAIEGRELRGLLDEELDRLPLKYRAPLVLCYLEGQSYTEAARQLGWRDGTVCGRLARARELLRQRLCRRGLMLSGAALVAALTEPSSAPATTLAAASRMGAWFALGQAAGSPAISPPVATLAQGVLQAMNLAKLKTMAAVVVVLGILAGGGGLAAHRLAQASRQCELSGDQAPERPQAIRQSQERRDRQGDPLPPEAIARLGTTRFRHGSNVFDIAFTPDGTRLISADWFGARLWDAASGREVRRLGPRFDTSLRSVSLSPDGKRVALAEHHFGTIQILDTDTGELLRQFDNGPDNNDRFCSVLFSPDSKILASYAQKIIRLWDPATGKQLRQWQADPDQVHRIVFAPDSKTLISGGDDRTIRFWDLSTGKERRRISDHPGPIIGLALSPDSKVLASLGSTRHEANLPGGGTGIRWMTDNKVYLWDAATGKKLRQLEAIGPAPKGGIGSHPNAISQFLFAPDGKKLLTAGHDRTVRIWDIREGKELRRWTLPWVTSLAYSPDGKTLAVGNVDCTIRFWDATTGRELREQPGHWGGIHYLALSPDGRFIASASSDRTVRIWDAASGRETRRIHDPEGDRAPVAFAADGRTLTTVGIDLTIDGADKKGRVWDVATGKELRQLPELTDCFTFAVSADGRTYALAGKNKQVWLWDAALERKLPVRIEHPKGISQLSFSPDVRALFGWCGDRKVHVWDLATGKEHRQFAVGDGGDANLIAISPDGRWLAWAGRAREIRLYELGTGEEVRRLTAKAHFIHYLAFAPDGRTLAATSMYDPAIYLWETESGQVRHRLAGHEGRIFTMVFSADGKRLLSGSEDTTALVWDLIGDHGERGRASAPSLRALWDELASEDAETAYRALRSLVTAGSSADFLHKQLQPIPEPDRERVARWIADLDHEEFARREKAAKELEILGETVEPALRAALAEATAEKRRRIQSLLAKLPESDRRPPSSTRLRMLRAIEILERIDTREARELLRQLAEGAPGARQTREAKAALERLTSRSSPGR